MESLGRFSEKSGYHATLAFVSVHHQMLTFLAAKGALRCPDSTDLSARDQEKPQGLPASVIGVGRKRLSELGSVGLGLAWVPHFCESFGTFVGI
jgi:hypothetical protein